MRLLIVSETGYSSGIASYLFNEGHSVQVLTGVKIPATTSIADISIYDSHISSAERLRSKGARVLGISKWSNLLENNSDYRDALIKAIGYKQGPRVSTGTDVIVTCWFNGQRVISKYIVFNYTKMMSGDVGASVNSSGYVALFTVDQSRLINEIVGPLEKFLRKANHRGSFSVFTTVTLSGDLLVRNISASGYHPHTQAVFENTRRSKSDVLLDLFNEASKPIPYTEPCVCGVLISTYPYPHAAPEVWCEMEGVNTYNLKHIWKIDMNGCFGYIMARGKDHFEAARRAYRTISKLKREDIQYRNDIGKGIGDQIYSLKTKGVI